MLVLAEPASIATKKKIVCHFVEQYVSRLYGVQAIQAWSNKNKGLHFFQMFKMSNVAYTLAVIDNGYAAWDKIHEKSARQGQDEDSTRNGDGKTRCVKGKYTSHSGLKRQYSHSGWNQDGMDFYNRVKMGWKKLSSENADDVWTELEEEWMSYMEEIKFGNWKTRDVIESGGGPQAEDIMTLPNLPPLVLEGYEDFKDDRPAWKKRTRLNPEENDSDTDSIDDKGEEEEDESLYSATGGTSRQANRVSLGSV
jgi:hypothetical protein